MRLIGPFTVSIYKNIPLAIVDDEDYDFISSFKWYAQKTRMGDYYYRCVHKISLCID